MCQITSALFYKPKQLRTSANFKPKGEERSIPSSSPSGWTPAVTGFLGRGVWSPLCSLSATQCSELCATDISPHSHLHEAHRHPRTQDCSWLTARGMPNAVRIFPERHVSILTLSLPNVPYEPDVHTFRVNFLNLPHSCPFPWPLLVHSQITCLLAGRAACSLTPSSL